MPPIQLSAFRLGPSILRQHTKQHSLIFHSFTRRLLNTSDNPLLRPKPAFLNQAKSIVRRTVYFTFRANVYLILGVLLAGTTVCRMAFNKVQPLSDKESLTAYAPSTPEEQAHEDYINSHPLVQELRANPKFSESRPHLKIPQTWRQHNLTAGTLIGPSMVPIPPIAWAEEGGKSYVQILYVGEDLCGHPGIVHGGFLATVLDEGLARCCFAALPNKVGLTANLSVDYRAPCKAGQYIVLRGETEKVEGRKVWVTGRIETLPHAPVEGMGADSVGGEEAIKADSGNKQVEQVNVRPGPLIIAEAKALYIEPKQASLLGKFYSST